MLSERVQASWEFYLGGGGGREGGIVGRGEGIGNVGNYAWGL
jgi:hypothetical protein